MTVLARVRRRLLLAAAVLAMAGAGLLALVGPASASTLHNGGGLRPEYFTITFPGGNGYASGPVHGAFTDNEVSATAGIWTFSWPWAKVEVDHSPVGQPQINPQTCTGFLYQQGNWQLKGLVGAYRDKFGWGRFKLWEQVKVARTQQGCCGNQVVQESVFVVGQGLVGSNW